MRYWRGTPIDSLVRDAISRRNIVVGGTSAGMAIMGKYIYTGRNGSVTSAEALANPYNTRVTIDSARFMDNRFLENVITDTHYDSPDRRGRHITFMARILTDWASESRGIACDEYTAVCIDENGIARVFGEYPTSNDNAYFLRPNCGLSDYTPEACAKGQPLQWLHSKRQYGCTRSKAIRKAAIPSTSTTGLPVMAANGKIGTSIRVFWQCSRQIRWIVHRWKLMITNSLIYASFPIPHPAC